MNFPKDKNNDFYKNLSAPMKMAILLNVIGVDGAREILAKLSDSMAVLIINNMGQVNKVPSWLSEMILAEYHQQMISENQCYFDNTDNMAQGILELGDRRKQRKAS